MRVAKSIEFEIGEANEAITAEVITGITDSVATLVMRDRNGTAEITVPLHELRFIMRSILEMLDGSQ